MAAAAAAPRAFGAEVSGNAAPASPAMLSAQKPRAAAGGAAAMSQAKLEAAFEKILEQNNNKLGEWEIRAKGLVALQELVDQGCCDSPHFLPLFTAMLQDPLLDMTTRSVSSKPALVKVGCATLSRIVETVEAGLDKSGHLYVAALMKNIRDGQTHGVIEDSQESMATLLAHVHGPKMIAPLTTACDSKAEKSPICRTAAIEHLCSIVQHWPAAVVKKQLSAIVECIRRMLADSSPGARTAARQCFWHLHARWESAASKLLASLEPSAVRQLNSARKAMGGEAAEEADEGSSAREVAHPRPKESARKKAAATPGATGATRAGEGSSRRTPGLGTAQRMGSRDGPAEPTRSAVKQSKTPRAQHHAASTVIPEEPLEQRATETAEASFMDAMKNCADGSAAVRLESFHELRQLCSTLDASAVNRLFEKLVTVLTEHAADGHEKVSVGCLEALGVYIESYGALFLESYLSRLLPSVLLKTVAKDRVTKAAVNVVLENMRGTWSHADLTFHSPPPPPPIREKGLAQQHHSFFQHTPLPRKNRDSNHRSCLRST